MAFSTVFMTALMAGVASAGVSAFTGSFAGAGGAVSFAGPGGVYAGPGGAGTFGNFGPNVAGPRPGFQQAGFQYQQPFNNPLFPSLLWPTGVPFPAMPTFPIPGQVNGVFQSVSSQSNGNGQQTSVITTNKDGQAVSLITTNGESYILTSGDKEPIPLNNINKKNNPFDDDFTVPKFKNNFKPFDPFKKFEPFQAFDFNMPQFDIPTIKPLKIEIPTVDPETIKSYVPGKGEQFHATGFSTSSFSKNDNGKVTGGGKYEKYENKDGKISVESESFGDKPSASASDQ